MNTDEGHVFRLWNQQQICARTASIGTKNSKMTRTNRKKMSMPTSRIQRNALLRFSWKTEQERKKQEIKKVFTLWRKMKTK